MADPDKITTEGREKNAAEPLGAGKDQGGPERYPSVRQDDSCEAVEPEADPADAKR